MEPLPADPEQTVFEELRRRRAELRGSMTALEIALSAATRGGAPRWTERVEAALTELAADFRDHIDITESPGGLYSELVKTAPRLSERVNQLTGEHAFIKEQIEDLLKRVGAPGAAEDVHTVRDLGTQLLGKLVRHRQRGSDLVYEAFEIDIGGET